MALAPTSRVLNSTQNFLFAKLVEGVLQGNTGISFFLVRSKAGSWKGAQNEVAFKYATNPNGGSFVGFDTLNAQAVENSIKLTYNCAFNQQNVSLAATDLALNDTKMQRANLMKRQIASDTFDLSDKIGTQFYGDGTGNASKDILGLAAIVDDGSTVSTIGGQSRTTYPQLAAQQLASGGTLTLAKMYSIWDSCWQDVQRPTLVLTTKTGFSLYNQLLEPKERYNMPLSEKDQIFMGTGASSLMFREAPIMPDSKATSGVFWFLNERAMEFQVLESEELGTPVNYAVEEMDGEPSPDAPKGLGFHWTGFREPTNQLAMSGFVVHAGNFVVYNPRFNGKLTGVTGI